jgi:hypothetical protein
MKIKAAIDIRVIQIPGKDRWMIQKQYTQHGTLFTDSNNGEGYTQDDAMAKASSFILQPSP